MKMNKKNLVQIEAEDRAAAMPPPIHIVRNGQPDNEEIPHDDMGNPLIVTDDVWKNTVVKFDPRKYPVKRGAKRIHCYGDVAFFDKNDMIVAIGEMRKLSRKGACFEIYLIDAKLTDITHLEFFNMPDFILNQVRVDIRVGYMAGSKPLIGVEFANPTQAFQQKLDQFIAEKRAQMGVFEDFEDI